MRLRILITIISGSLSLILRIFTSFKFQTWIDMAWFLSFGLFMGFIGLLLQDYIEWLERKKLRRAKK